jgi:hypothetical protein
MNTSTTDLRDRIEDLRDDLDGATDYESMMDIALDLADAYMESAQHDDVNGGYDHWDEDNEDDDDDNYSFESVAPVELAPPVPEPLIVPPGYEGRTPSAYRYAISHPQTWDRLVGAAITGSESMVAVLFDELHTATVDDRGRLRAAADGLFLGDLDYDLRKWRLSGQIHDILNMVNLDIEHLFDLTYPHSPRLDISELGWNPLGGDANGQAELLLSMLRRAVAQNSDWMHEGKYVYKVAPGRQDDAVGEHSYDVGRGSIAEAENAHCALHIPKGWNYLGPERKGYYGCHLVVEVVHGTNADAVHREHFLLVSHQDIREGFQLSDLTEDYRAHACDLLLKGVTDTRVWRATFDGMPLDYAIAASSGAA